MTPTETPAALIVQGVDVETRALKMLATFTGARSIAGLGNGAFRLVDAKPHEHGIPLGGNREDRGLGGFDPRFTRCLVDGHDAMRRRRADERVAHDDALVRAGHGGQRRQQGNEHEQTANGDES
jgi:hypothetical protein